jgi:hypothetical protein
VLHSIAEYVNLSPTAPQVQYLWEVLRGFTPAQRTAFLRFTCARSRLPASTQYLPMTFKVTKFKASESGYAACVRERLCLCVCVCVCVCVVCVCVCVSVFCVFV